MKLHDDTIAAISTPHGVGGIAVIRLSGTESLQITKKIFRPNTASERMESHRVYYGKVFDDNMLVDEVLVVIFQQPNSYTGEDVVEISCHGGTFVTQRVLETILKNGARHAEKGEFTKRAFINGKIDLTEAEGVIDLIHSKTKHSMESALNQLEGKLHAAIQRILEKITSLRVELELDIDFSDQGLEGKKYKEYLEDIEEVKAGIEKLIASANEGLIIREGYRVVIAGPTNAGKSSVFNRIIENERSIVTEIPGTTRDYIEEDIALKGYLVKLYDTAGLREGAEDIEKVGIKRSYEIMENAHLILWIEDCSVSRETTSSIPSDKRIIPVWNKLDLVKSENVKVESGILVSAKNGSGIEELKTEIVKHIETLGYDISSGVITNSRQLSAAEKALSALKHALSAAKEQKGLEFISFDLQEASEYLEEIIGKISSDEIINSIFDRFCVGK